MGEGRRRGRSRETLDNDEETSFGMQGGTSRRCGRGSKALSGRVSGKETDVAAMKDGVPKSSQHFNETTNTHDHSPPCCL